jgi:hypothetical protein
VPPRSEPLERRETGDGGTPVDQELSLAFFGHGQHQLLPFDIGRKVRHLNGHRADGPGVAVAADRGRAVRRLDLRRERPFGALDDVGSVAGLAVEAAGLEDDECELRSGRFADGRNDRVPLARRSEAGDAALDPAEGPRVANLVFAQVTWGSMSP